MRASNYCKVCGTKNAANLARCSMCSTEIQSNPRKNPMASSSFRSPSIVIFDIDDTILDVTQRYKDAVRAGYIDKERGAKRKKTFETPGKARKRAMEFLFSPDNLRKDRVVPGSIALINTLMEQGHTIVYVTARNAKYRDVTRTQLEDKGFPIFKDDTDMELLFFKPTVSETAEKYKLGVYAKLLSKYDVRMVFDDKAENLQMAASLGITGIYPTIRDYTKYQVKSNPHSFYSSIVDDKGYPKEDPDEEPYQSYRSHADESGMGRTGYSASNPPLNCGCGKTPCMTFGGLNNPGGIQSKVESILIKEGGAAGLKPLKAAFPKGTTKAQATAAIAKMSSVYQHPAGDYILKNPGHSENYMVPRDIHRLGKAADRLEETYEDGLDTPEWWKSKLSVTAKDADTIADSLDYVADNPYSLNVSVQVKGYRNTAGAFVMKGKKFLIIQRSKKETSKHGLWELPGGKVEKGETMRETAIIETQEEAGLDVTLKVNLGSHIDHKKKKVYHAFIATPKKGQKVKLSFEHVAHKWVTPEEVRAMPKKKVSHHLMYFLDKEEETIRSNPFGLFKKKKEAPTPPKPKSVKPTPAIEKKLLAYNNALIEYNDEYEHNEGKSIEPLSIGQQFVFDREPMAGGEHIYMIYDEGAMNGMFAVLKQVGYKVSDINTGESVTWKEFMKDPRSDGDRFGRYLTATETEHHKLVGYLQYLADEGKINGRTVHYTYKDGTSAGWRFQFVFGEVKNNPRSNPPKNKIEKGKKLYEHMNGKAPEKIEKKKIDMGDVWYQVGEGGCWQIGYMSGKETGKSEQKYTHTFNEETKDGNFPKLYATMPENGKPLLIIQGGTWKIRTDDKGVAWIYD